MFIVEKFRGGTGAGSKVSAIGGLSNFFSIASDYSLTPFEPAPLSIYSIFY